MTEETPAPKKPKPTRGPGSAARTKGEHKGRFKAKETDRDIAFDIYYAMGGGRSHHRLSKKIAEELNEQISVQTIGRWSQVEGWTAKIKQLDHETGANIAELLKNLEDRGQRVGAAHFKGLLGFVLQAAQAGALNVSIKTPADLEKIVEICIKLEEHAASMSQTAGPLHATNGAGKVVNMGDFSAAARAAGAAAPAPNGNGKDKK